MTKVTKEVKKQAATSREKSSQLALFEILDTSDSDLSNTIELYDALPKFVWVSSDVDKSKNNVITRQFKSRGSNYQLKIKPAVIERTNSSGEVVSVMVYPGAREEIVEEALRKFAVNGQGFESDNDKEVGVFFTVSKLRKELARTGHSYSAQEVLEALDVMSSSLLEVSLGSKGKGRDTIRGNMLSSLMLTTRAEYLENGSTKCFATFHPLVTQGIKTQKFRLYDYSVSMTLKSDLARYMYKRMSHYWTQASLSDPYQLKLVSFLSSSPRGLSEKMKDNLRAMRNALKSLVEGDVILPDWTETMIKDPADRRVTTNVEFSLLPSETFVKHMMKANKRQSDIRAKAELKNARLALESGASADRKGLPETESDQVFS
ncbi:replication protein [Stutzerimonas xanthomarina]|jgi:hypothetical protein|uniref:Replication protein n=1 Tax=Stutzerimonas xanthomarina TaxID=271420 RepID=A0A3R9AR47_9GAMM|nr:MULTISPECIES: hypothetical protein [Stutzerimonas]MBK3919916.1 replication protein [Stutzerimonas frequens]RRV08762.1 replication protein [Stutzerimonas xanthomarina]